MSRDIPVVIFMIIILAIKIWLYVEHIKDLSITIHILYIITIVAGMVSIYKDLYSL